MHSGQMVSVGNQQIILELKEMSYENVIDAELTDGVGE